MSEEKKKSTLKELKSIRRFLELRNTGKIPPQYQYFGDATVFNVEMLAEYVDDRLKRVIAQLEGGKPCPKKK